jgi:hypothetical protein
MSINIENAQLKFHQHRAGAAYRGIPFLFTFEQWLGMWVDSGKWHLRGKGGEGYVMARKGDVGPYSVENVEILTAAQNSRDAHRNGRHIYREPQRPGDYLMTLPPTNAPSEVVDGCESYRDAVRTCWKARRVQELTMRSLAAILAARPQHVSDWIIDDDLPSRRDLPAYLIRDFEWVCGNTLVSQWLAARSSLTVLEEMQAERAAA